LCHIFSSFILSAFPSRILSIYFSSSLRCCSLFPFYFYFHSVLYFLLSVVISSTTSELFSSLAFCQFSFPPLYNGSAC
jgi:hypothetical protein